MSGGEDIHIIVLERQGGVVVDKELYHLLVLLGHYKVALLHKLEHSALGELVKTALRNEFLPSGVDAEEYIQHDAGNGHEIYHQSPCHGLHRLAVVHYDMYYCRHLNYYIDNYERDIHCVHCYLTKLFPMLSAIVSRS